MLHGPRSDTTNTSTTHMPHHETPPPTGVNIAILVLAAFSMVAIGVASYAGKGTLAAVLARVSVSPPFSRHFFAHS
jgi:hypothetical protein